MGSRELVGLIERFCMTDNLECYDPYDVWMTELGIRVKKGYNRNKILGILPAASLTIWDYFLNNKSRWYYKKKEYPTVRATAALTLLNLYGATGNEQDLMFAKKHIDWLIVNSCNNYSGLCWGLGFKWAAGDGLDYDENTPFSTHTPYALEAIHKYIELSGDLGYVQYVERIYEFFESDIQVMFEDERSMATSYGPSKDRLITNAVSYALYAYAIFSRYIPEKENYIRGKVQKLYNFVSDKQLQNGSWLYEPDNKGSFIDCFHSCFILKNIFKADQLVSLVGSARVVETGYNYVKSNFYNPGHKLFKRFTLSNKPSLVKFDLYDNAEMLHLSVLLGDKALSAILLDASKKNFMVGNAIYSVIDLFHLKRNKNTLRWAVMPYLYALSAELKAKRGMI